MSEELKRDEEARRARRRFLGAGAGLIGLLGATKAQAGWNFICDRPKPCFLKGTKIETENGPVAVEALKEGDRLRTVTGHFKPVRWVGVSTITRDPAKPWTKQDAPVLIAAGALADGVPHADLYVSPDHAIYIDGVLVPAKYLVNDRSIRSMQDFDASEIVYVHVELDRHEVVFAEGAPTESFLEWGNRDRFDNAKTYSGRRTGSITVMPFAPLLTLSRAQEVVVGIKSALLPGWKHRGRIDIIHATLAARADALTTCNEPEDEVAA